MGKKSSMTRNFNPITPFFMTGADPGGGGPGGQTTSPLFGVPTFHLEGGGGGELCACVRMQQIKVVKNYPDYPLFEIQYSHASIQSCFDLNFET